MTLSRHSKYALDMCSLLPTKTTARRIISPNEISQALEAAMMSPYKLGQAFRPMAVWAGEVANAGKGVAKAIGWLLFIGVIAGIALRLYESYESHQPADHDTPVWIQNDWLVGEYRVCQMRTKMQTTDQNSPAKLPRLFCAQDDIGFIDFQLETDAARQNAMLSTGDVTANVFDSYFHVLPVRYYGFINTSEIKGYVYNPDGPDRFRDFIYDYDRTDKFVISWRCQRKSESLTCTALS